MCIMIWSFLLTKRLKQPLPQALDTKLCLTCHLFLNNSVLLYFNDFWTSIKLVINLCRCVTWCIKYSNINTRLQLDINFKWHFFHLMYTAVDQFVICHWAKTVCRNQTAFILLRTVNQNIYQQGSPTFNFPSLDVITFSYPQKIAQKYVE